MMQLSMLEVSLSGVNRLCTNGKIATNVEDHIIACQKTMSKRRTVVMGDPSKFYIVPHTHWDREWYLPFQVFRSRLVDVVDELLDILDRDHRFAHFLLDGQTAAALDYLEIRPENRGRLEAAISSGRIATGPFHILMDEFLVSGETIIRNLTKGMEVAESLGGCSRIAYLPDMFGHISQMPQILARAGIGDAVVWRGVPSAINKTVFRWESPDGSAVRTAYLATSYSNGASLPSAPEALKTRLEHLALELDAFDAGGKYLIMNGTDHAPPQPELPAAIHKASELFSQTAQLRICSLGDYFAELPSATYQSWNGEFRSGARVNLLMGVVSNRVDIRRLAAETEDILTRYSEPLLALYAPHVSRRYLDLAWDFLIQNSAHDSICACSVDEVTEEVRARFLQAHQIAKATMDKGMEALSREALRKADVLEAQIVGKSAKNSGDLSSIEKESTREPECYPGILLFNPSLEKRGGIAEIVISLYRENEEILLLGPEGKPAPAQIIEKTGSEILIDQTLPKSVVKGYITAISSREVMGYFINEVILDASSSPRSITIVADRSAVGDLDIEEEKARLLDFLEESENSLVRITAKRPVEARLLVEIPEIPGLGWGLFPLIRGESSTSDREVEIEADARSIENRYLRVDVTDEGTYTIVHKHSGVAFPGLGRLVDGGEWGDTYNYSPPPNDSSVTHPADVRVDLDYAGPLGAGIRIERRFSIPSHVDGTAGKRSWDSTVDLIVCDLLELRKNEPFLRVTTEFENNAQDHRLRVHFPLPFEPQGSFGGGAFDVVERGLEAEGGPHEFGLPTFPARGFVDAWGRLPTPRSSQVSGDDDYSHAGLAVLIAPVTEYEIVDNELAVTLLRATGMLSRPDSKLRPAGAGPSIPTRASQCLGHHRWKMGIMPHIGRWNEAGVHYSAEQFVYPVAAKETVPIRSAATGARLDVSARDCLLSALIPQNDQPLLRVWTPHERGSLKVQASADEVSITGRPLDDTSSPETRIQRFEAGEEILVGPYQIRTLRLTL